MIDQWIEETVSSKRKLADRQLGKVIGELRSSDLLIVSELSRLGRNLMEIMSIPICVWKKKYRSTPSKKSIS